MSRTTLNLTAICDKAGRPTNQDNFWLCPDLSSYAATGAVTIGSSSSEVVLSEKGALLVVADGMGGMSAGEVASQIVVDSIKKIFSNLDSVPLSNPDAVKKFIKQAIIDADKEIKKHAESHPETAGMGSTIVLVWLLGNTAYVGWCGDSRAYCYNAQNGLVRLTHDHSYVQELVDSNKLTDEDAFDHPDSNIITRSLGDSGEKANPDVKDYPLHTGDTFLLCSDGLCGLLRDSEIESILSQNTVALSNSLNALWKQGTTTGWTDNVTIELAKVVEGGVAPTPIPVGYDKPKKKSNPVSQPVATKDMPVANKKGTTGRCAIFAVVALLLGMLIGGYATKLLFPSYPADVADEIKALKIENDSLRLLATGGIPVANRETEVAVQNEESTTPFPEQQDNANSNKEIDELNRTIDELRADVERLEKELKEARASNDKLQRKQNDNVTPVVTPVTPVTPAPAPRDTATVSKITPEFNSLIDNTKKDFERLEKEFKVLEEMYKDKNADNWNSIFERGISSGEVEGFKNKLEALKTNLKSIKENASYSYLEKAIKDEITAMDKKTTEMELAINKMKVPA